MAEPATDLATTGPDAPGLFDNLDASIDTRIEKLKEARELAPEPAQPEVAPPAPEPTAPPAVVTATPAEPAVEPPAVEPIPDDWWETGLPAKHGFLRGRKGEEVEKAFRSGEASYKREAQRRAELEREIAEIKRQREAPPPVVPPAQAPADTEEEIDRLWLENPSEARRMMREEWSREEQQRYEGRRAADVQQQRFSQSLEASNAAIDHLVSEYGIDKDRATKLITSALPHMSELQVENPNVWQHPANYVWVLDQLGFLPAKTQPLEAAPPEAVPAPVVANPPGSKRPAAARTRAPDPSPLRAEEEEKRRAIAEELGLDPENLINRARARGGRRA